MIQFSLLLFTRGGLCLSTRQVGYTALPTSFNCLLKPLIPEDRYTYQISGYVAWRIGSIKKGLGRILRLSGNPFHLPEPSPLTQRVARGVSQETRPS